jgi:hypothetical protein
MMKNKLYGIFDAVTMVFSPLIERLFDHAEVLSARRRVRRGKTATRDGVGRNSFPRCARGGHTR